MRSIIARTLKCRTLARLALTKEQDLYHILLTLKLSLVPTNLLIYSIVYSLCTFFALQSRMLLVFCFILWRE